MATNRSRSRAEHRALGRVQIVVWLGPEDAELLADLEAERGGRGARSSVIREAIRELAKK